MGIGVSLILIAVGAILTWAVSAEVSGVDLQTVGIILMVVGAVGGLISLIFWSSWGGSAATGARPSSTRATASSSVTSPDEEAGRLTARPKGAHRAAPPSLRFSDARRSPDRRAQPAARW